MNEDLASAVEGLPEGAPVVDRREFLASLPIFGVFRRGRLTMAGIRFRRIKNGGSSRRYLHIHGNENTARETLVEHLKRHKGTAWLIESRVRNVPLKGGQIDPNRMFTREGAERSLRALNREKVAQPQGDVWLSNALRVLDRERGKLIRALTPPSRGLLVALHNNSSGYSVRDEVPLSNDSALNDAQNPHEFFLCTDPGDFKKVAFSPFNAVLQNQASGPDDGSLSRLSAKLGVRYVNIECALGKADRQRAMLGWLEQRL